MAGPPAIRLTKDAVIPKWLEDHPDTAVANWKKANPKADGEPKPEEVVGDFFTSYAALHQGAVPVIVETEKPDTKEKVKSVQPVAVPLGVPGWFFDRFLQEEHSEIQAWFFDMWLQAHPDKAANIEPVPADMVTASGSGLDPHITLRNARYQLARVAKGWKAKNDKLDEKKISEEIGRLLDEKKFKPLGVAGEDLVNVLEVNLALRERFSAAK